MNFRPEIPRANGFSITTGISTLSCQVQGSSTILGHRIHGQGLSQTADNQSIARMPRKPIDLPPDVARRFLEDMHAFFSEPNPIRPRASHL
jgi:hypothetical protein